MLAQLLSPTQAVTTIFSDRRDFAQFPSAPQGKPHANNCSLSIQLSTIARTLAALAV